MLCWLLKNANETVEKLHDEMKLYMTLSMSHEVSPHSALRCSCLAIGHRYVVLYYDWTKIFIANIAVNTCAPIA